MADPRANFRITADNSDYKRKLDDARRRTETFAGSVQTALRRGALAGAAAVTAAAFALTRMTQSAAKAADQVAKTSDKLGIATEKLVALQLAGRLTGVQNEKLSLGLQRMTRRIAEAAQGAGEAQGALRELGLDAQALSRLSLDQQFEAIAQAMSRVDNQSDRIRLGFKLFDSEGVDLIRTLGKVEGGLGDIEAEARAFGIALSRVEARQLEQASDALVRAQSATQGLGTTIALAIAPIQTELATAFADAARASNGFRNEIQATMEALVVGANFAVNSVRGIQIALEGAKLAALRTQESAVSEGGFLRKLIELRAPFPLPPPDPAAAQAVRDEIDETGRTIDALIGKVTSAEVALQNFRLLQEQSRAAAVQSLAGPDVEEISLAGFEEREKVRQEKLIELAEERAARLLEIEKKKEAERLRLNQQTEQAIQDARNQTADLAVGLLQTLGARSKAFAIAAILLEKGLAIQRLLLANRVAAELAFASQIIPGDPTSLARAAAAKAAVLAQGKIGAILLAATGIAQIATLGSGSTGAPLGTPTNPIFTQNRGDSGITPATRQVNIVIQGNGVLLQDQLVKVLREATDADEIIIHTNSRQAAMLRGGL